MSAGDITSGFQRQMRRRYKFWVYAVLIISAVLVFIHTAHREWIGDDLCYRFMLDENDLGSVETSRQPESFTDVWDSQIYHYCHENGRLPLHLVIQTFSSIFGQTAFAAVNAVVFTLFIVLTVRLCFGSARRRRNPWAWLVVALTVFYLFPGAGGIRMGPWYGLSMAVNYLWVAVLFESFILMFRKAKTVGYGKAVTAVSLLLGFFTGWSNEAFSLPLSGAVFILWVSGKYRLSSMQKLMMFALWTGAGLLVFSPGTISRISRGGGPGNDMSSVLLSAAECYTAIWIFWIFLAICVIWQSLKRFGIRTSYSFRDFLTENRLLLLILCLAVVLSIYAHSYSHSLTCIELLSMILAIRLLDALSRTSLSRQTKLLPIGVVMICFVAHQAAIIHANHNAMEEYRLMIARYKTSPDGVTWLNVPDEPWYIKPYTDNYDMMLNPDHYCAVPFAAFYGLDKHTSILPFIISPADYSNIIGSPQTFFRDINLMPGSAGAYKGDDYFFIRQVEDSVTAVHDYTAVFNGADFMKTLPVERRLIYKMIGSRKRPKQLDHIVVDTRHGRITALPKILSTPSSIEIR